MQPGGGRLGARFFLTFLASTLSPFSMPSVPQTSMIYLAWLAAIGGLTGFVVIAMIVQFDVITPIDRALLLMFRAEGLADDPVGPAWLEEAAAEITALGGFAVVPIFYFAAVGTLILMRCPAAAIYLSAALFSGIVLSNGIKWLFARPRPDFVSHLDRTFTSSFPSAHASFSMVAYLTIALFLTRFLPRASVRRFVLGFAGFLVMIIGVSRIYLGVHWPTDVLAGWLIGLFWAALCWLIAHHLAGTCRTAEAETCFGCTDYLPQQGASQ